MSQNVESTLIKIQQVVDGETSRPKLCHGMVGLSIQQRKNPDDVVCLYGTSKLIFHSVLMSKGKVVTDSFSKSGKPVNNGYKLEDDFLPSVLCVRSNYFLLPDEHKGVTLEWLNANKLSPKIKLLNLDFASIKPIAVYTGPDFMGSLHYVKGSWTFVKGWRA